MLNPLWDLFFTLILGYLAIWYFLERPSTHGISSIRQCSYYLGILLATIILVGPIAHLAVKNFTIHMVQHVGLMMLISPLIVLGAPIKLARNSKFPQIKKIIIKIGRNKFIRQLFRAEIGFVIFFTVLVTTHFSPLANAGMLNSNIHVLELLMFLVGGFIYYYPVLEGNPKPFEVPYFTRILSLFAMMLPETMTGFFLYSGNKLLHDIPMDMNSAHAISQQHSGGAIMWAFGMLIDATWIASAAYDWFTNERKMSELSG